MMAAMGSPLEPAGPTRIWMFTTAGTAKICTARCAKKSSRCTISVIGTACREAGSQTDEADDPDAGLALQRQPHGNGLHVTVLRSRSGRRFQRYTREVLIEAWQ